MTPFATVQAQLHITKPFAGDPVLGEADAIADGRRGKIVLTTRGMYLVLEREGLSWGIDLNALAVSLVDAVAPPKPADGGRNR